MGRSEALNGCVWGLLAVTADGDTLVNINGETRMLPASNMKLITTGAALCRLGPDFSFRTGLFHSGELKDSTLVGDLYITGGGDPSLCDRYLCTGDSLETFRQWREKLAGYGIRSIEGRIIGDARYFNGENYLDDWSVEDFYPDYSSAAYGLNISGNLICTRNDSRTILPLIPSPPLHCASQFSEYLRSTGVPVSGEASCEPELPADSLSLIAETRSVSLSKLIEVTNRESENVYAEAIFRQLGKEIYGTAVYDTAGLALCSVLHSMGLGTALKSVTIVDGSGLSRKNYVTPEFIVSFLREMSGRKEFPSYLNSLPRAGSGTLKRRLASQPEEIRSRVRMKSGSMTGVRCFSGYILPSDGDSGKMIAFSLMTNNALPGNSALPLLLDEMIGRLAAEN